MMYVNLHDLRISTNHLTALMDHSDHMSDTVRHELENIRVFLEEILCPERCSKESEVLVKFTRDLDETYEAVDPSVLWT